MSKDYYDCVTKYSDRFRRVLIDPDYVAKIDDFSDRLAKAKASEEHHVVDGNKAKKRFMTGLLGEAALEKVLGIKIIDWTIGDSANYQNPDIPGYRVGIKTVEKGKFPIIFKNNWYPQIICIRSDYRDDLVFVCGLATTGALNSCQDDDLILDPNLRARGTKTGFYGFEHLISIQSLNDLQNYKKNL